MAIQTIKINSPSQTVYTSTGSTAVTFMSICNWSVDAVEVDVHLVPFITNAPLDENIMISQLTINAGDTYILYQGGEKIILDAGDFIVVHSSDTSDAVSTIVSYIGV